ncbi:hypothetical protein [uncultured Shewanella sp.]|uniref:hypothetical protein n=1 Tax=uncultured Shewanella sp. TaxID=173975 RepID=UPI00260A9739|nr:hypothetical protein [uncultured Shewanella sp.]
MGAVISPDFCVRPALCNIDDVENSIKDIIILEKIIRLNITLFPISLCEDLMTFIEEKGFYPTDKIFKKQILESECDDIYSVKDLVVALLNIIDRTQELCENNSILGIVYDEKSIKFEPSFSLINSSEIGYCYKKTLANILAVKKTKNQYNALVNPNLYKFKNSIQCNLKNSTIYTQTEEIIDKSLSEKIEINSSVKQYLLTVNTSDMYRKVNCIESLQIVLFCKTLQILKSNGKDTNSLDLDSFILGNKFFDSLFKFQCNPNSKFSEVFLDTAARLLAGFPKNQESAFRVGKETTDPQKQKGNKLAYRTHVTKSKEGLRLMYWKCQYGFIELANVGNKGELEIL